ncbi:hypothetical protein GCM10023347_50880 [Streptomyces chumphonensis]|uniref:ATP-binding protein n=1 Tax=Streptomyces chumphonensis TaxID=1214925 RepID=UPI00337DD05D
MTLARPRLPQEVGTPGPHAQHADHVAVSFAPHPERAGQMREVVGAHLRLWGCAELVAVAQLVTSELVTNAILHGAGGSVHFRLARTDAEPCIEVDDGSPGRPRVRNPGPDDESGRGMLLVDALAHRWGTSEDGTNTWCVLLLPMVDR